ncbi:MAG: hypothetical protein G8237_11325 [Magnetococcales bacterium]|nr:hypothetical protein [Magnetococcales bacterium]
MVLIGIGLWMVWCTRHPAAYFVWLMVLIPAGIHALLRDWRFHHQSHLGYGDAWRMRDRVWVGYQMVLIAGYGYVLACRFPHAFFQVVLVVGLSLGLRQRLQTVMAQRRFFYWGSLGFGVGYAWLMVLVAPMPVVHGVWTMVTGWMQIQQPCNLVRLFDAFNVLADAMIQLLPFPLDWLLAPINLHLLFGPLVTASVLGLLRMERWCARFWHQAGC